MKVSITSKPVTHENAMNGYSIDVGSMTIWDFMELQSMKFAYHLGISWNNEVTMTSLKLMVLVMTTQICWLVHRVPSNAPDALYHCNISKAILCYTHTPHADS